MTNKTTLERLTQILVDNLGYTPEIKGDIKLETLVEDSLDRLEILMAIEEEFEIEISDKDAEELPSRTVDELVGWLDKHEPARLIQP